MTEISEDDLYEIANVYPDDSRLPMAVWVRPRSNQRHAPASRVCTVHGPRMLPHDTVTVALRPIRAIPTGGLSAADLRAVSHRIQLNETAIVAHWEGQISAIEFGRRLQKQP